MDSPLVLIVEDRDTTRTLVCSLLAEEGYRVLEAGNGAEALEVTRLHRPDLVLMDLEMPRMGGMEACRRIHEQQETADTPVLAVTALDFHGRLAQLQDAGFAGYLRKPYTVSDVLGAVAECLASTEVGRAQWCAVAGAR